jgi:hypothetical protein
MTKTLTAAAWQLAATEISLLLPLLEPMSCQTSEPLPLPCDYIFIK